MKYLVFLCLLYLVLSQAPKGKFINISVNNTHTIGKVDSFTSTHTFYFPVPRPRRECSSFITCYNVEIATFDSKRNKVYFLLSTTVQDIKEGKEIHFYELDYNRETSELKYVKSYIVLAEYARNHVIGNIFVEGLTMNEETNEVFIHLYRSKIFILNPLNGDTRLLYDNPYWQPSETTTIFSQKDQSWFLFDLHRAFYVQKRTGRMVSTRKLEPIYKDCSHLGTHLIREEQSKAIYVYCQFSSNKVFKRMIVNENNIDDSLIEDPTMEIGNGRVQFLFTENGIIYFVDFYGNILGFNALQPKPVYEGKIRYSYVGKTFYAQ